MLNLVEKIIAMDVIVDGESMEVSTKGDKVAKQPNKETLQSCELENTTKQRSTIREGKCVVTLLILST